ncbi:MAG: hypothetical protein ACFB20_12705 [Opitutales bacterium]
MPTLSRNRIRVAADAALFTAPLDQRTAATPAFWRGNDLEFEIAVFSNRILQSVANLSSLTVEIRARASDGGPPEPSTPPLMTATIEASALDDSLSAQSWDDGTGAHARVNFTAPQSNVVAGDHWLLVQALTTDNPARRLTLTAGPIRVLEDGGGLVTEPPEAGQPFFNATESDARYSRVSENLADLTDPAAARNNLGISGTGGGLDPAQNLSDVADRASARANLGVEDTLFAFEGPGFAFADGDTLVVPNRVQYRAPMIFTSSGLHTVTLDSSNARPGGFLFLSLTSTANGTQVQLLSEGITLGTYSIPDGGSRELTFAIMETFGSRFLQEVYASVSGGSLELLDEDDFASASATQAASQQSIQAYLERNFQAQDQFLFQGAFFPIFAKGYNALAGLTSTDNEIRVLVLGDSLAWRVTDPMINAIRESFGFNVRSARGNESGFDDGSPQRMRYTATGGASVNVKSDYTIVPSGNHIALTAGGSCVADILTGNDGAPDWDTAKVIYQREPGAGTFKVQVSDGADTVTPYSGFADVTPEGAGTSTISASHTETALGVATFSQSAARRALNLVGLSGNVKVLGIYLFRNDNVVSVHRNSAGSWNPANLATTDADLLGAFITELQPDLITWQNNDSAADNATGLAKLKAALDTTALRPAVLVLTVSPNGSLGLGDSGAAAQRDTIRDLVRGYQRAGSTNWLYFDCYKALGGDYDFIAGLPTDPDVAFDVNHLTAKEWAWCAQKLLQQAGLAESTQRRTIAPLETVSSSKVNKVRTLQFQKSTSELVTAKLFADPTFGADLQVDLTRMLELRNSSGSITYASFSARPDQKESVLPERILIGPSNLADRPKLFVASGQSPEGIGGSKAVNFDAKPGSLAFRPDAGALDPHLYIKESGAGNTGWVPQPKRLKASLTYAGSNAAQNIGTGEVLGDDWVIAKLWIKATPTTPSLNLGDENDPNRFLDAVPVTPLWREFTASLLAVANDGAHRELRVSPTTPYGGIIEIVLQLQPLGNG